MFGSLEVHQDSLTEITIERNSFVFVQCSFKITCDEKLCLQITYENADDAKDAAAGLDGKQEFGQRIKVELAHGKVRAKPWDRYVIILSFFEQIQNRHFTNTKISPLKKSRIVN